MMVAAYAFHEKKENDQHVREQGLLCLFLDWRENLAIPLQYVSPDSWFFECQRPFTNKPDGHNWVCCTKCTAVRPGLESVLWDPSNPQHMLIKDLTPFMQTFSSMSKASKWKKGSSGTWGGQRYYHSSQRLHVKSSTWSSKQLFMIIMIYSSSLNRGSTLPWLITTPRFQAM